MKTTTKRDEPAKRGDRAGSQARPPRVGPGAPERGAPATHAAHAVRKDVTVRVSLQPPTPPDGDELREDGYGHGV